MEFALGFAAGVIACAIVAHNKPEWFNRMVQKAADKTNDVQDKVKEEINK